MTAGPVLARLDRPATDERVRIAVIADPHVTERERGTWKCYHRTVERFRAALTAADRRGADAVVLAGDLTADGRPEEFDIVDGVLGETAVDPLVVPGNHDVPKTFDDHDTPAVAAFEDRYGSLPATETVGPVTLLAVDSASDPGGRLRDTWGGAVGPAQREWLADRAADAAVPIVLTHHPLTALPEHDGYPWTNFQAGDREAVRSVCRRHGVELVVSAHHHVPALARHSGVTELLSPAVCSFPQATLELVVGPEGTTVRLVPLADRAGVEEAYHLARGGKALGRGICTMTEARLARLPLSA
ncbi:metallophosphoesterase family protein [Haloarcula halophila]|uniref:metallophosphoesterase family protein n=1 Tax=Haloarcula TaxID=2237 RepID=UPI0023E39B71|nr:metallophosphoesterase [Halomicroarcula sp. DFY41]